MTRNIPPSIIILLPVAFLLTLDRSAAHNVFSHVAAHPVQFENFAESVL